MDDHKFKYTTLSGDSATVNISLLHMAKIEMELNVSISEWDGRLEPQLAAAHLAWSDSSATNNAHFLSWCSDLASVDGHKTFCTVGDSEPVVVPYRVFVEAERFFGKSFLQLSLLNTLNLRMFIVWKILEPHGGDFYRWLGSVPPEFVCDVYSESERDANPKE